MKRSLSVAMAAVVCALLIAPRLQAESTTKRAEEQSKDAAKKIKDRRMRWDPPDVDGPLRSVSASPPCDLSDVLQRAGVRAQAMKDNLPNFTASERIEYQALDRTGAVADVASGTFEYLALFVPKGSGWAVQETRTPLRRNEAFPASGQDVGLPALALIFLPNFQKDYDMKCEGAAQWNGEAAWVIHFRQRPDKPSETLALSDTYNAYPVKLKGRAWLAVDSGEVLHLETGILEPIPIVMRVRSWWLAIDYGPVQFHSQNVTMWLPQTVDAYEQYDDEYRTIIYHTFADFMVFSVQAQQEIKKPTEPH